MSMAVPASVPLVDAGPQAENEIAEIAPDAIRQMAILFFICFDLTVDVTAPDPTAATTSTSWQRHT